MILSLVMDFLIFFVFLYVLILLFICFSHIHFSIKHNRAIPEVRMVHRFSNMGSPQRIERLRYTKHTNLCELCFILASQLPYILICLIKSNNWLKIIWLNAFHWIYWLNFNVQSHKHIQTNNLLNFNQAKRSINYLLQIQ